MKAIAINRVLPSLSADITRVLVLAEKHRIKVTLYQLSQHWVCAVQGEELAHVKDLPKIIDAIIAKCERPAA